MAETGWTGVPPEAEAPSMPLTEMLLRNRERGAGDTLALAQARSRAQEARSARDAAANARDPDSYAVNLVNRGYAPGLLSELSGRLADTEAELAGEQEKLEKSRKQQERIHRDHAAGKITAFDIARMHATLDDGDAGKVERLQRRRDNLRQQISEAAGMAASPEQRLPADPVEAAVNRAATAGHQLFLEATRARWAEAQGTPRAPRAPRPFPDSISRSGAECAGPDCPVCTAYRALEAERAVIR